MARLRRNDPCHCGSGKKYKYCCLTKDRLAARQATGSRMPDQLFLQLQGLSAELGGLKPAEAMVRFAQPLIDQTQDREALENALSLAQICWNLALLEPEDRERALHKVKREQKWTEQEYQERRALIDSMIQRHEQMFPVMHRRLHSQASEEPRLRDPKQEAHELMYEGWEELGWDLREAERLFKKALRLDPELADAYNGLGELARAYGDVRQAEVHFRTALEKARVVLKNEDPQAYAWWLDHETRPYMRARLNLGMLYESVGRYDEAIVEYQALLKLNPGDNQGVRYLLAPAYQYKGDLAGALQAYEEFARDYPDDIGEPFFNFSWGLALFAAGKKREAVAKLRGAFFGNLYLAPLLLGQRVKRHRLRHGISTAELDYVQDVPWVFQRLWKETPGALTFLRRLWTDPEMQSDIKEYLEVGRQMEEHERGAQGSQAKWKKLCAQKQAIEERRPSVELLARVLGDSAA